MFVPALAVSIVLFVVLLVVWRLSLPNPGASDVSCSPARPVREPQVAWAALPCVLQRLDQTVSQMPSSGEQYLIVGAGFLGCRIAAALVRRGETHIRCADLSCSKQLKRLMRQAADCIQFVQCDICNAASMIGACTGARTVFATAALLRFWEAHEHQWPAFQAVNVDAVDLLLRACKECGVARLIYTSTSNVAVSSVHASSFPCGEPTVLTEASPLVTPGDAINHYSLSKAAAELTVLAANDHVHGGGSMRPDGLLTASVRPCSGIFGLGDTNHVDACFSGAKLAVPVPWAITDFIHVDNVVWGHLLCEAGLRQHPAVVGGEAFAITNRDPLSHNEWNHLLKHYAESCPALGVPRVGIEYPPMWLLAVLAWFVDRVTLLSRGHLRLGSTMCKLTRATLQLVHCHYIYDDSKAARILGYSPIVSLEEGIMASFWELAQHSAEELNPRN